MPIRAGDGPKPRISPKVRRPAMPPFTRKEVACYLLWVAIVLMAVGIAVSLLFYAHGREPIHAKRNGATVMLRMPAASSSARG